MTREEYEKTIDKYVDSKREEYETGNEKTKALTRFKVEEFKINSLFFNEETDEIQPLVAKIIESIKEQELTYDQAYATLEQVYNHLKYESNFTKIK